jgi:Ca-activated chloride channel family protein
MTLQSPWWLLLLVPVALLAAAYVRQQRRRSRYAVRFASTAMLARLVPHRPGWRRHLPATGLLLAFGLLGLAAARPEMEVRVPREQATVMVVVDTSLSMRATDVAPSRIEAASAAASDFVSSLPDDFAVGVVAFSDGATVMTPPTTDHRRAAATLQDLTLHSQTAIGEGVLASLDQIAAEWRLVGNDEIPSRIVLLSDGENTAGRPPELAAEAAADAGVPVSTIAYGSGQQSGGAETLAAIADRSGGTAYSAESGEQLSGVYEDVSTSLGWRTEEREVTPYISALALLAGLAAATLSLRWFTRLP